jgi:hypothetical protein
MKITKQVTQQVELEIELPMFRKRNNGDITHYYAFYSDLSSENLAFSIEGERLNHFHNFCYLSDCTLGEEITFAEFYAGLLIAQSYLAEQVKNIATVNNGEYYLDQIREDYGSTAGEATDDLGFQEFENTKL